MTYKLMFSMTWVMYCTMGAANTGRLINTHQNNQHITRACGAVAVRKQRLQAQMDYICISRREADASSSNNQPVCQRTIAKYNDPFRKLCVFAVECIYGGPQMNRYEVAFTGRTSWCRREQASRLRSQSSWRQCLECCFQWRQ